LLVFLLGSSDVLYSQVNEQILLAQEYYQTGELVKAKSLYDKLARNRRNLPAIHRNYLDLLMDLKEFDEALDHVTTINKIYPANIDFMIDKGLVYLAMGEEEKADEYFNEMIMRFKDNEIVLRRAAQFFYQKQLVEYSIKTYQLAREQANDPNSFALELASIYRYNSQKDQMIQEYLKYASSNRNHIQHVKNVFQEVLKEDEDLEVFESIMIEKLQKQPGNELYGDFMVWVNLQQEDFYGAFVQARAMEKRRKGNGDLLLEVGIIAMENEDYSNALKIFNYIIQNYKNDAAAGLAKKFQIQSREQIVKNTFPVPQEEIQQLISDYQSLIDELGPSVTSYEAMRNMALLYAFYLYKKEQAISILTDLIQMHGVPVSLKAQSKLDLGDIYLFKNEPWESTLLYSQVEKTQKESPLGYEAKLKNAKLNYFTGNFKLAQEHLDVLKLATTREISNDAIALSAYIKDNTILDTSDMVMKSFATIELLVFQNKYDTAETQLRELIKYNRSHDILDEAYWLLAKIHKERGEFAESIAAYRVIATQYGQDILADDALIEMGKLYESSLNDPDQAMACYQELLREHPGSNFAAEARRRFRKLRGDLL